MIKFYLNEVASIVAGTLVGDDIEISNISTDSNKITSDCMFVALVGERFDAHKFIDGAINNKAAAVLLHKKPTTDLAVPYILVKDTLVALSALAKAVRDKISPLVFAITGSCGKTTVKTMLANIAAQEGKVKSTPLSYNNHVGVPLSLLSLAVGDRYGVFEIGANHSGEIAELVKLVQPDIALINNIAPVHLEGFGTVDKVAYAKAEIFTGLHKGVGVAVLNYDDAYRDFLIQQTTDYKQLYYSLTNNKADVFATDIESNDRGFCGFNLHCKREVLPVQLAVAGKVQIANALAAATMALAADFNLKSIVAGLQTPINNKGRMNIHEFNNLCLIDDTYNANVHSVKEAISYLSALDGRKCFILGELAELGADADSLYHDIGLSAQASNINNFFTIGSNLKNIGIDADYSHNFVDQAALLEFLKQGFLQKIDFIFIKGSRSANMDALVDNLLTYLNAQEVS